MDTKVAGKFNKGENNGTSVCTECGARKQNANMERTGASAICNACYDLAGIENEHADGYHVAPDADCPECRAEAGQSGQPVSEFHNSESAAAIAANRAEAEAARKAAVDELNSRTRAFKAEQERIHALDGE